MSTYMHLVCEDHDPPLLSEDEVGQHHYDLPTIRAWIHRDRTTLPNPDNLWNYTFGGVDYFGSRAVRFLQHHPRCRIGIRDEYGVAHPTEDPDD